MLILPGSVALSAFRRRKLLQNLQAISPTITDVSAVYMHFVRCERPLDEAEQAQLQTVLTYGEEQGGELPDDTLFLVTPRPGTISPWSSKATDIARNCGLDVIERIERGTAYYIQADSMLDESQQQAISTLLHDRMVETVFADPEQAEQLFSIAQPEPLREVDISADAQTALAAANVELGLALSADEIDYLAQNY
ncbi:MAG: phosphoribosylformylglycinamidine synthase, partial [Thiolinea sp.]